MVCFWWTAASSSERTRSLLESVKPRFENKCSRMYEYTLVINFRGDVMIFLLSQRSFLAAFEARCCSLYNHSIVKGYSRTKRLYAEGLFEAYKSALMPRCPKSTTVISRYLHCPRGSAPKSLGILVERQTRVSEILSSV